MAVFICLFTGLGAFGLVGPDEPRYAWIARAMAEGGDWVTPRLYGQPWFEKPIFYYWAAAVGFRLNLPPEWAARLPSALAALAAAVAIGWLGWRHYGGEKNLPARPALLAPLIFSTSVAAIGFSRAATPDMLFSAFITLAMACAARVLRNHQVLCNVSGVNSMSGARDTFALAFFGVFLGLAVLAKGPAGVILAGGAIGLWALVTSQWRAAVRLVSSIAIATFCVVALPWYILCAKRNPDFIHIFIFQHNFQRYLTPLFQHKQPFWFFGWVTLLALLPWTVLLLPAGQEGLRLWREKSWADSPGFFFACWAIFPIIFFSASQSKLPGYILPAIPALALLCSVGAIRAFQKSRLMSVLVTAGLGLVWITIAVLIFVQALRIPSTNMGRFVPLLLTEAAIVVAILLALAIVFAGIFRNLSVAAIICSLSVVAILVLANIVALPAADTFLSARPHAAFLRHDLRPDRIFTFELNRSWNYGLAFYFRRELPEWSPQDPEPALVLTTRKGLEEIVKAGRSQGDLNESEEGIFYVPVGPVPR
ncbi:MAG TPA: glycosyltransferase family 39 protein [Candidatus Acidoferrales bacterium]|nr:glycosyltransferase family 39 protein [Candidatus Acidoferrales bacterium]